MVVATRLATMVRALATGLLAALLVCEGVYFLAILPDPTVGYGAILAGLVVPLLLGRTWRDRGLGYVGMLPGIALGAAGYAGDPGPVRVDHRYLRRFGQLRLDARRRLVGLREHRVPPRHRRHALPRVSPS